MGLVPVQFYAPNTTACQPNLGHSLHLAPACFAVHPLKSTEITDLTASCDTLDRHNLADDLKSHRSRYATLSSGTLTRALNRAAQFKPVGSSAWLGGFNVDDFAGRRWRRNWLTVFSETFDVELDRFADKREHFVSGLSSSYAARKIRNVGSKRRGTLLNNDEVAHRLLLLLQARLLQDTVQRSGRKINIRFACDRDGPGFARMPKLTVASLHANLHPAIGLEHGD